MPGNHYYLTKPVFGLKRITQILTRQWEAIMGAEVCELVGLNLLNLLTNEFGKNNIGLHRDDGLSCFQNISGPDSEKIKKKMGKIFKENGLNIIVKCNLAITDFWMLLLI